MQSSDKAALLKSMGNLIKHISSSREAQQEIFQSLERKDLEKIITNLTDPLLQLRLISAQLIGELLHECHNLQQEFCKLMGIHYSHDSEIVVGGNFGRILELYPQRAGEIFKLIKMHHSMRFKQGKKIGTAIWYINPEREALSIQYLSREQVQDLVSNLERAENPEDTGFDPMYCIFGILTSSFESQLKHKSTENTQLSDSRDLKRFNQNPASKPAYFQPYVPRQFKVFNYPLVNNNNSNHHHCTPPRLNTEIVSPGYGGSAHRTERAGGHEGADRDRSGRKISLTEGRRKQSIGQEASNIVKFTFNDQPLKVSQHRPRPETSKSLLTQVDPFPTPGDLSLLRPTAVHLRHESMYNSSHVPGYGNGSNGVVAPSMKVKNIAMNGRQGWETAKSNMKGMQNGQF